MYCALTVHILCTVCLGTNVLCTGCMTLRTGRRVCMSRATGPPPTTSPAPARPASQSTCPAQTPASGQIRSLTFALSLILFSPSDYWIFLSSSSLQNLSSYTFLILISNFVSLDPCVYSTYTVRKGSADLAVCDWWRYCIALCDVKFSQIEGNGRKFRHIELSNRCARGVQSS